MSHRHPRPVAGYHNWIEELMNGAGELGISLDSATAGLFREYAGLLQKWGRRINLTSRLEPGEILSLHILDSLGLLAVFTPARDSSLVDLGSGAGFPGIPLKLARPDLRVTLLEPNFKKAAFLTAVIDLLGLREIAVERMRAEKSHTFLKSGVDLATARAVAPFPVLLSLAAGLVRPGGSLAAWKGADEGPPDPHPPEWSPASRHLLDIPGRPGPRSIFLFTHL